MIGVRRLEAFDRERPIDDRARLGERRHRAGRQHLHRDVAERGRLDRPGDDRAAGRIGGELIQQTIARAAADDADLLEATCRSAPPAIRAPRGT